MSRRVFAITVHEEGLYPPSAAADKCRELFTGKPCDCDGALSVLRDFQRLQLRYSYDGPIGCTFGRELEHALMTIATGEHRETYR